MRSTRFVVAVVLAALASTAATSLATTPALNTSAVPRFIDVVGTQDGMPDRTGAFTVVVRDFANNPVAGSRVILDFSNCTDLRLCRAQANNVEVNCATSSITGLSNAAGQVTFVVIGGGNVRGSEVPPAIASGPGDNCMGVIADGVALAKVTAVHYDPNGATNGGNGVTPLDISIVKNDVGAAGLTNDYRGRSDHSHDGKLNPLDLSYMKTTVGLAGLGEGSGSGCATASGPASYCP